MEYPEEIYATRDGGMLIPMLRSSTSTSGVGWGRQHAHDVGHKNGYDVGYKDGYEVGKAEQSDPLAGYSNLTSAISAGEPIDYERLDGLKVQCVNSDIDTLRGKLVRDDVWPADSAPGWVVHGMGITDIIAWYGEDGWTLWIEGEIPLVQNKEYGPFQKPESK